MKPKEWLYKHGHIKEIGRGRLSREHIALIQDAVAKGTVIEGYSIVKPTADAGSSDKPEIKRAKPAADSVLDVGPPLRDETMTIAKVTHNGETKVVGMRTVCNTCKCSLTYCPCAEPIVNFDHDTTAVVTFYRQTTPTKARWY